MTHGLQFFLDLALCAEDMAYADGNCCISIDLSATDISVPKEPDSFIVQVPRCMYLTAFFEDIENHFDKFVVSRKSPSGSGTSMSFSRLQDNTEVPWYYPCGLLVDMFGLAEHSGNRLHLTVRFGEYKGKHDRILDSHVTSLFGSLYLNQLKVSLSILGIGLSNLNILSKECLDKLLYVAVGPHGDDDRKRLLSDFWDVFKSIFEPTQAGGVVAIKLYVVQGEHIFSTVTSFPVEKDGTLATVTDLLNFYNLSGQTKVQGVELRNETPLLFLRNECHYADGFVHLVTFVK